MPNYEYKCSTCDTSEEHYRSIDNRDAAPKCQYCQRLTTRVILATPAHFKGSGFYSTGG